MLVLWRSEASRSPVEEEDVPSLYTFPCADRQCVPTWHARAGRVPAVRRSLRRRRNTLWYFTPACEEV